MPSCTACAGSSPRGDGDPALATLKVGGFRSVDVTRDEVYKEGAPFWLCRLLEPAYQLSAPHVYAGDSLDEAGGL